MDSMINFAIIHHFTFGSFNLYTYIGMSEKYQVECINEVYMYYQMKMCCHLTDLSCTEGVLDI